MGYEGDRKWEMDADEVKWFLTSYYGQWLSCRYKNCFTPVFITEMSTDMLCVRHMYEDAKYSATSK